ncbi:MAG TPA: mandelate racemase [Alphaproteobacteria bacterium]|nr:mandelate racemase [Alphaproteobacteria bacterium]
MSAVPFRIVDIEFRERPVRLRLPFRFGVVTLTHAPQAFAFARIELADGRTSLGAAAEMLAPKWFDKNLALSNEQNFDQLRTALAIARGLYLDRASRTAFGHFAVHYADQVEAAARHDLNPLVAGYGPALIDRAVLDALCRALGVSFYDAIRRNIVGIVPAGLLPEFAGFDIDRFVGRLSPRNRIAARHTVGLVDPITAADIKPGQRVGDGLPETLEEVVTAYGHSWFKLKVGGDVAKDIVRLSAIASVLDRSPSPYRCTLDGNEQYDDVDGVIALWRKMGETPALRRLVSSIAFIEQPINRKTALERDVAALGKEKPLIIDESDGDFDAFPRARSLGYAGVSSKTCKNFYKSILNAARCAMWNEVAGRQAYFMSGEDLTTQAGLSVQQDLALVSLLGLDHVERNGHHYVNGMADLPPSEQQAFLTAHPDLYQRADGVVRLKIESGMLAMGSLGCTGFASGALPEIAATQPMPALAA